MFGTPKIIIPKNYQKLCSAIESRPVYICFAKMDQFRHLFDFKLTPGVHEMAENNKTLPSFLIRLMELD